MMTTRVVEDYTESRFVTDLHSYTELSDAHLKSLPKETFDVRRLFNYYRTFIYHAQKLQEAVQKATRNPEATVDSTIPDPFNNNDTYLQHNVIIVKFYYTILVMNFLRGTHTYTTEHIENLLLNLYLNVLDIEHPVPIEPSDIQFLKLFATYIFKLRPKLVNIGEKEYTCDLFSNILSRIHAVIEVCIMINEG